MNKQEIERAKNLQTLSESTPGKERKLSGKNLGGKGISGVSGPRVVNA